MEAAQRQLASQVRVVKKRPVRIPADAFVGIGSALHAGPLLLPPPLPSAVAPPQPQRTKRSFGRGVVREIVFFALFALTLAAMFYVGQIYASYKVIVVPEPSSARNVVT